MKLGIFKFLTAIIFTFLIIMGFNLTLAQETTPLTNNTYRLLSDPFIQLPTETTVNIVWFTEFAGDRHEVVYGDELEQKVAATTTKLSRVREDNNSQENQAFSPPKSRNIWRHEATVKDLISNQRYSYQVNSIQDGKIISSKVFTLASKPSANTPLKILLTSDHQLMPMTAANLQKETSLDAVFIAGDLINIPDRASEWFDDSSGGAFFPCLQGRASYELEHNGIKTAYSGGEIIQHIPLFPAIGNHEVMGRFSADKSLKEQFADSIPQAVAAKYYQQRETEINPTQDSEIKAAWLKNNSFNTDTYEEIFSLPKSNSGGKKYYATTFGDIRLVVLYVTNIWRSPELEPDWLQQELASEEFQQAKYKIVMFHHPPHTLGGNIVPPYTDPQPLVEYDRTGELRSRRYQYPIAQDYIVKDLIPLLESSGVDLVYYGHSHLWNRFVSPSGTNFLESSNVGNTYGAHLGDNKRPVPTENLGNDAVVGDPNGLEPVVPNIAPLIDEAGQPLPYIASNDITVFSILDTAKGTVSSYRYDTRKPNSAVVKFDEFEIKSQ